MTDEQDGVTTPEAPAPTTKRTVAALALLLGGTTLLAMEGRAGLVGAIGREGRVVAVRDVPEAADDVERIEIEAAGRVFVVAPRDVVDLTPEERQDVARALPPGTEVDVDIVSRRGMRLASVRAVAVHGDPWRRRAGLLLIGLSIALAVWAWRAPGDERSP